MNIVHSGFDGLKLTIDTDIPGEFREALLAAKLCAASQNTPEAVLYNGIALQVRKAGGASAFSVSTGTYGAEWYFLDPQNKPKNNPGVTVDFRAFLLATGGIEAARALFEAHMAAFGIRYADHLVKVSRVDFAVDIIAPGFEPDRKHIVAPANTRTSEREAEPGEEHGIGEAVSGIKAGHISNRQLAIYDKRREVIDTQKLGWLEIWDDRRAKDGKTPLDLQDKNASQVWRFELRMGSKQLRNRWEIRGWASLETRIGDALAEFTDKFRYALPNTDSNRSRWPTHPLWAAVTQEIARFFDGQRSFAEPTLVKQANREAHKELLDSLILGTLVSRAVAEDATATEFDGFVDRYCAALKQASHKHTVPIEGRFAKAAERYVFE